MKYNLILFSIVLLISGCNSNPRVNIKTEMGDITVEIYTEKAPLTALNFLKYVEENRYEGAFFYRVVRMDNQPKLDFGGRRNPDGQGFAAFGKVIDGMDVVKKIHSQPANGQYLEPVIPILDIGIIN